MTLKEAILSKNLEAVKQILTEDPPQIDEKNENGVPLCLIAAATGFFPIVKYIVEYSRASMNTVDEENRNILHYAAMSGNTELAKYLVEKVGMDIISGDKELITPYQIAYEKGHKELLSYFQEMVQVPYQ